MCQYDFDRPVARFKYGSEETVSTIKSEIEGNDPPYADAINYHELTEYFLAWNNKFIEKRFSEWCHGTRRVLAVKGTGENFNKIFH